VSHEQSPVKLHQGDVLLLVADTYPTVFLALMEMFQNAVDVDSTHIEIEVNKKRRIIFIRDNGNGVTRKEFDDSLLSVGKSKKSKDKYGRYGRGLVSFLGKGDMEFTSCSKSGTEFTRWTFITKNIRRLSENLSIPCAPVENLRFSEHSTKHNYVPWRTQVKISNYSTDRLIGAIPPMDELIAAITGRYGLLMRQNKVRFDVTIIDEDGCAEVRKDLFAMQEEIEHAVALEQVWRNLSNRHALSPDA